MPNREDLHAHDCGLCGFWHRWWHRRVDCTLPPQAACPAFVAFLR